MVLYFFKFQKRVFDQNRNTDFSASDWLSSIEFILHSNQEKEQTIIKSPEDLQSIKTIIQLILNEHNLKNAGKEVNLKALLILLPPVLSGWQNGNHPALLYTPAFIEQKIDYPDSYRDENPVRAGFVGSAHEYWYSSANPESPLKFVW